MLKAFKLGKEIEEEKFLRSKDFSIIFCKTNISSLCFACIASTVAKTADIIALAIDYLTMKSIKLWKKREEKFNIIVLKRKTPYWKALLSVSQKLL